MALRHRMAIIEKKSLTSTGRRPIQQAPDTIQGASTSFVRKGEIDYK